MEKNFSIQYISRAAIDDKKWNHCITNAKNGFIYAYTYYLDTMARNWSGLILDDYAAVMPLTWHKKLGIHYLYQPFLTPVGGIFGSIQNEELALPFLNSIPAYFKYIDISLNTQNQIKEKKLNPRERLNFVLSLQPTYKEIEKKYSTNHQRNIRKSVAAGCTVIHNPDVETIIALAVAQMNHYGQASKENIERFRQLYAVLLQKGMTKTYGIASAEGNILSSCVFFLSHQRAYYILVGNAPESRTTGASHLLIDAFIRDNATKNLVLDFEGSDIPGLADFYSGFGAMPEYYQSVRWNRLPFYLKWLKK